MQWNYWGDMQTDIMADIHFTYIRHAEWITRCGTINANSLIEYPLGDSSKQR